MVEVLPSNDGTTIEISDSKITTSQDDSGGTMTTGGGTMIANNLEITTSGTSSAAIRTDRGGGTINSDNNAKSIMLSLDATSSIKLKCKFT